MKPSWNTQRVPEYGLRNGATAIFIVALAVALLAVPVPSDGQQPAKVYRIGFLEASLAPTDQTPQQCPIWGGPNWQAFMEGLREHGYVPGQNLVIECRWTEGQDERALALAAELVSLQPDLIVAANAAANVRAAQQATRTIPIVLVNVTDPVGRETAGKLLQLLKEVVPRLSRVAVLVGPADSYAAQEREMPAGAARALGLTLQFYEVRDPKEFAGAFTAMTKARADALLVLPYSLLSLHTEQIVQLAAQSRLPAAYPDSDFVQTGGLLSYGANYFDGYRHAASYVDKIFKGTKPADLPVEQPTKFELVINLATAKALGLTIPQSLLDRADRVIR